MTADDLAQADRAKLVKLLGLLASEHAGERDAAALAAVRLLKTRNLTWSDLLGPPRHKHWPATWREACTRLLLHPRDLSGWEFRFCSDISRAPSISAKQRKLLFEIAERVLGGGE